MVALAARGARLRDVRFRRADRDTWNRHVEPAPLCPAALGPDAAAVADDDLLADVQTEAHSRGIARRTVRRSIEETEDRVELLLRDTDPFVSDGHAHAPVVLGTNVDRDSATARRVLDRVRQEVVQHLFPVVGVLSSCDAIERNWDFMRSSSFSCS